MTTTEFIKHRSGDNRIRTSKRGREILDDSLLNKGTAFTPAERRVLRLEGLVPSAVFEIKEQVERAFAHIARKEDDLEKYIGMISLQDRNEVLFYRVLLDHLEQLMPVVYTPTVGQACASFSQIFRRGRGVWISPNDAGRIDSVLDNADNGEIKLIVVTDGERILGLGDQGAGGMGIPIGKLSLYTVAAGIHPRHCLPVCLDVGTDNQELLDNKLYVGLREPRLRGPEYDKLVDEFVSVVKNRFPKALLQWEDFKKNNAINLLNRYRRSLASFNDDIQGTASVGLAAVLAAGRVTNKTIDQQTVVILGAGAAGVGIAHQIRDAMARAGLSGDELSKHIAVLDSQGLLADSREISDEYKKEFSWREGVLKSFDLDKHSNLDLLSIIKAIKPTVLIGTSGQAGAFSEKIIKAMAENCEQPAIFPFSNPTSKCEARPDDILNWTDGCALVATGSPFPPVDHKGKVVKIAQSNNVYVFPGIGLGCLVAETTEVTDSMFTIAAETIAEHVESELLRSGTLFPPLTELRRITHRIAVAVVKEAKRLNLGKNIPDNDIDKQVYASMWNPEYSAIEAI